MPEDGGQQKESKLQARRSRMASCKLAELTIVIVGAVPNPPPAAGAGGVYRPGLADM